MARSAASDPRRRDRVVDEQNAIVVLTGFGLGGWLYRENFIKGYPSAETLRRRALRNPLGEVQRDQINAVVGLGEHVAVPKSKGTFLVEVMDWEYGNVAGAWRQLGSALNLSRADSEYLRQAPFTTVVTLVPVVAGS